MSILIAVTIFLAGLIFGSFFNVCIYRLPRKKSIIWPGSQCSQCKSAIKPWDNIPLLSFLILHGKCRICGYKISWRYPLVEALTGFLFVSVYLKFGFTIESIPWFVLAALLVIITFIDIEFQLILNKITLPGVIVGIILSWQLIHIDIVDIGLGLLVGGGLLVVIAYLGKMFFGKESMGMGDVKMAAMIGVFIGAKGIALALFFGFFIAGIFSVTGMALKKLERTSYLPFGPFIAAGTLLYIFLGEQIVLWYFRTMGII